MLHNAQGMLAEKSFDNIRADIMYPLESDWSRGISSADAVLKEQEHC